MQFASTNSAYDAANVFLFATDNTNVEWTLKGGFRNKKITYILGTNNSENSVTSLYGLTKSKDALFPDFKAIFDIHSHPYDQFASPEDINSFTLFPNVKHSLYFVDERTLFKYTDKENSIKSIKVNSMDDLMKYIFQQLK